MAKHVFKDKYETARAWVNQSAAWGREGKRARIFFEGDTIYSYGRHFPIARLIGPKTALVTTRSYSLTTSRHMEAVLDVLSRGNYVVYYVDNVLPGYTESNVKVMLESIRKLVSDRDNTRRPLDKRVRSAVSAQAEVECLGKYVSAVGHTRKSDPLLTHIECELTKLGGRADIEQATVDLYSAECDERAWDHIVSRPLSDIDRLLDVTEYANSVKSARMDLTKALRKAKRTDGNVRFADYTLTIEHAEDMLARPRLHYVSDLRGWLPAVPQHYTQ